MTGSRHINKNNIKMSHRHFLGKIALFLLIILLMIAMFFAFSTGSLNISLWQLIYTIYDQGLNAVTQSQDYFVLIYIRAPRIIFGALVGSALAISGAILQGLFRNPLADPGIMGITSGAAVGAIGFIVLGYALPVGLIVFLGPLSLMIGSFLGGLIISILLYSIATKQGRTSIATMLLAGIAISAFCMALIGIFVFLANDPQLRDISFWNLGTLAGATWYRCAIISPFILTSVFVSFTLSRPLNALSLGEPVAGHLGFSVQHMKNLALLLVAIMTGLAVSVSGGIGFVGIIIPHVLRLTIGPDHRYLLPCSALLGASFLIFADNISRVIVAPAELPIGIITALFGAPIFLWILLRQRGVIDL